MKLGYQREAFNSHWFQLFNAISVQILMGAPAIVFAKSLGASSTVLGIIASFGPMMTVLQLPAARHLGRYSYRQFVLAGWSARSVLIFVIAVIPLLAFLDNESKMAFLLAALFVFHLLRGISTGAWMPWISALIAENVRGRFLGIDQCAGFIGSLVSLLVAALALSGHANSLEYALVFFISAAAAMVSLVFIRKIPDITPGPVTVRSSQRVPWRAIIRYQPFQRLLIFNVIYSAVIGSLAVFTVEYLRDVTHFNVAGILYVSAFSFLGALAAVPFLGATVDQVGGKLLLRASIALLGLVILFWLLCAASVIPNPFWLIALLNFLAGVATAVFGLANMHIVMTVMPEMGRNHFYALFNVINSLCLSITPIGWGLMLDAIGSYEVVTGAFHWKPHSIYFLVILLVNAIAFAYIPRLHESAADRSE